MSYETESKRCKRLRIALICLFVVCGYLLSTTYAVDILDVDGVETYIPMTALNLAFGAMGGPTPVRASKIGFLFIILPFIGFFFTFFDKKTNIKNVVSLICGVLGVFSICFLIGGHIGMGAFVSIFLYMIIAVLSAVSVIFNIQDRQEEKSAPRLERHE